jgi:hypothetical protein
VNNAFLTLVEDIGLQQMVDFHTRNNATLDLFLTNRPSLINRLKPIPGISDHDALFIDSDVQAKLRRTISRQIFLWKKADLEKLQNDMQAFCQSFISKFSTSHPIDSLWTAFKNGCLNVLRSSVPPKMATERYSQPWIRRLMSEGRFVQNKSSVALFLVWKSTICCRPISSTNAKKALFTPCAF